MERAASEGKEDKILIAEDEELNYLLLEASLKRMEGRSFTILHAKNGQEAVEKSETNGDIVLVLMDIRMPVMNGYEAAQKIKAIRPNLPIIAQTAYTSDNDKEIALKQGCDDFIAKPIDRRKLFELINKYAI